MPSIARSNDDRRGAATAWMIRNQLGRRNISAFVRAELALKLKPVLAETGRQNMSFGGQGLQNSANLEHDTRKAISDAAQVSHDTINKVERIVSEAPRPVYEAARRGDISIHRASKPSKHRPRYQPPVHVQIVKTDLLSAPE